VGPDAIIRNSDIYGLGKLKRKLGGGEDATSPPGEEYAHKEAIVGILKSEIKIRQRPPRFLMISSRGVDSEVNADILNALVSILIEQKTRVDIEEVGRNYQFIESEMKSYQSKLEEAETALKKFREQHIGELPTDANTHLNQLTNDKSELLACELEMKELTRRVEYLDEQLKKQDELVVSEVRRETNPMLVVVNQRIVELEIELNRLRINYTDLHPRVIELEGELANLKKQRQDKENSTVDTETSMLNPVYQALVQDKHETLVRLEVLNNRMANLDTRIKSNEQKVKSMPAQEQELITLTRNYDVTANIYNMLLQNREEVRLQEKLASEERGSESLEVMQYARAAVTPVAPEKPKLMMFIAMAALGVGVGIIGLKHYLDDSLNTIDEAKEFIGKPLLGTVPSLRYNADNGHHPILKELVQETPEIARK
jgi:polysaccharide chain length determinant protein (PEP-CTERM system associated)